MPTSATATSAVSLQAFRCLPISCPLRVPWSVLRQRFLACAHRHSPVSPFKVTDCKKPQLRERSRRGVEHYAGRTSAPPSICGSQAWSNSRSAHSGQNGTTVSSQSRYVRHSRASGSASIPHWRRPGSSSRPCDYEATRRGRAFLVALSERGRTSGDSCAVSRRGAAVMPPHSKAPASGGTRS